MSEPPPDDQATEIYFGGPPPTIPASDSTMIWFGGPDKAAASFVVGQGFEPISFNQERKVVNVEWAERRE